MSKSEWDVKKLGRRVIVFNADGKEFADVVHVDKQRRFIRQIVRNEHGTPLIEHGQHVTRDTGSESPLHVQFAFTLAELEMFRDVLAFIVEGEFESDVVGGASVGGVSGETLTKFSGIMMAYGQIVLSQSLDHLREIIG